MSKNSMAYDKKYEQWAINKQSNKSNEYCFLGILGRTFLEEWVVWIDTTQHKVSYHCSKT